MSIIRIYLEADSVVSGNVTARRVNDTFSY
ncbi:hypothetical protein G9G63_25445 [Paenibacillus sp. EKM202P]|nr:hypothetical protein [Paenibacillus sp. EKM202P]KAF6558619.1 hypothetical protein G9G63_25445 [Paenibacillus sp. EKM202P]KAF6563584.1 hypothetical protein G9G64_25225 [Paenibacillus sp. EKM207P]